MQLLRMWDEDKQLTAICCVCGRVRDDISRDGPWKRLRDYLRLYGLKETDPIYSHTFCPPCLKAYEKLYNIGHDGRSLEPYVPMAVPPSEKGIASTTRF